MLVNDSLYQQSQRVVNTETATYENVLFNNDITNFVGTFTCEVSNVRSAAQETVELNGRLITLLDAPMLYIILTCSSLQVCLSHETSSKSVSQLLLHVEVTLQQLE